MATPAETGSLCGKATLYLRNFILGYTKIEVREVRHWLGKHAQYEKAVHAEFIEKRKRKRVGIVETYQPSLVILDGWGHPALPSPFDSAGHNRHVASDAKAWQKEFNEFLSQYLQESPVKVLADYRGHDPEEG